MAKKEDIQSALNKLVGGGIINLSGSELKKRILRRKIRSSYGNSLSSSELDDMVSEIYESGRGELMTKLDSDLAMISSSLNSVVSQAPALLSQMASIPASKISVSPVGPTVPNPVDIKNSLGQIKAQAESLSSILAVALSKVIELDISEEIPDSVLSVINVLSSIKNFPI